MTTTGVLTYDLTTLTDDEARARGYVKGNLKKEESKTDLSRYYRDLNAQRRSALGTKG